MLSNISNFLVGRDRRGRWAVSATSGQAGGIFVSREAALRYARLETARRPGAVRQSSALSRLALNNERTAPERRRQPAGWSLATSSRGFEPHSNGSTPPVGRDKKWLILDIGIAVGFALLCLAVGLAVS